MRRALVVLVCGGWVVSSGACVMPFFTREPAEGRLVRAADGHPVADAEVHVESADHFFGRRREVVGTYETRTGADGRWLVRGHGRLELAVLLPDGAPSYGDAYRFRAPDGAELAAPDLAAKLDESGPLRVVVDPSSPVSPVLVPAFGLVGGGGQTVSVHGGAVFLLANKRFAGGLRAVGEIGGTGYGGAAGVVVSPLGLISVFVVEANARWLRSWGHASQPASRVGPEIAVTLLGFLRTSVSVLPDDSGPSRQWRGFLGAGWGYL